MSDVFVPAASPFPQISGNRTAGEIVLNLLSYIGGEGNDDMKRRANAALAEAIREYDIHFWTFNRRVQTIALADGSDFTLEDDFAGVERVHLLDTNGGTVHPLRWLDSPDFRDKFAYDQNSVGSEPLCYTTHNTHEDGLITVWPTLVSPLSHPTIRVAYFRRIILPEGYSDVTNIPREIESGIYDLALAKLIGAVRGMEQARDAQALAYAKKLELCGRYEAFEDF